MTSESILVGRRGAFRGLQLQSALPLPHILSPATHQRLLRRHLGRIIRRGALWRGGSGWPGRRDFRSFAGADNGRRQLDGGAVHRQRGRRRTVRGAHGPFSAARPAARGKSWVSSFVMASSRAVRKVPAGNHHRRHVPDPPRLGPGAAGGPSNPWCRP